jgi:hypothetical protein
MMYARWLDSPYWDLDQVLYWNCPPGGQLPIDQLLRGLKEGRIVATGRRVIDEDILDSPLSNRPSKLGDREPISALAWLDLTIIESEYTSDLYVVEWSVDGDGDHRLGREAWRHVRIKRDDALAFWAAPDACSTQEPAVRSGLPGKPTSKHLYLQKLAARIETGEVASSLEREATFLKDWLKKTHPEAPSSGLSAIKNNIRKSYNQARVPGRGVACGASLRSPARAGQVS